MDQDHYGALIRLTNAELEKIFKASRGPVPESLAGYEWRGTNAPWFTKLLGIQKFIKGFFRTAQGVEGYNIPVRQNGLDAPWLLPDPGHPKRFGFFRVDRVDPGARDNFYPQALLLDYGASRRNAWYRVEKVLRDYVVCPDPKNPRLLLGKAYLALGPARVFSNFFVIERLRPTAWEGR